MFGGLLQAHGHDVHIVSQQKAKKHNFSPSTALNSFAEGEGEEEEEDDDDEEEYTGEF